MSSVFMIQINIPYEGYVLPGVYSSEEKAIAAYQKYSNNTTYYTKYLEILEVIVDAPVLET